MYIPYFACNAVILTDSNGVESVGEVPGGKKITDAIETTKNLVRGISVILLSICGNGSPLIWTAILLVKENHQPSWWFQKALAMPRIHYPSERRRMMMIIKRDVIYSPNGENRKLHIYLPNNYYMTEERYPVMYFFDGHNLFSDEDATYGKSWGLKEFLENWGKSMIIVGMECSHNGNERLCEYLPYPAGDEFFGPLEVRGNLTLDWIIHEVKPMIDQEYRTYPNRECTGIAGSSMGGLMAIRAAVHYNQCFSKAACVSSAIGFCPGPLMEDVRSGMIDPDTRVYLSWGSREAWGEHDPMREDPRSESYHWNHGIAWHIRECGGTAWAYCQEGGGHCEADWEKLVPDFMDFLWMQ